MSQPAGAGGTPTGYMRLLRVLPAAVLGCCVLLGGCSRFHSKPPDKYVYVTVKETYLIDRVAAVSNRTGTVNNGEKLTVLDHGRNYVKVKTPEGAVGWIREKAVATEQTADAFAALAKEHAKDPTVGNATVRDEVYMHVAPGREAEHFVLLAEGDKLQLLARATLPKVAAARGEAAKVRVAAEEKTEGDAVVVPPPVMEDWWLARDSHGHTGWVYSHMVDVDAPDTLVRYAEGQRIVGAYVLTHVNDPDSGMLKDGQPDPNIPIYVTVLSPYKAGLPYDFDQVRVFTWNVKKHRYETAMRERNIEGYLPVKIGESKDPYGHAANSATPLPSFTYRVLSADAPAPVPDPVTGLVKPGKLIEKKYRLEGNITRRILAPGAAAPEEAHPAPEPDKKGAKKHKR
ncbi:MAG TPA: SH3 domain-containing protein [Acidobacteriaceae bacterium]